MAMYDSDFGLGLFWYVWIWNSVLVLQKWPNWCSLYVIIDPYKVLLYNLWKFFAGHRFEDRTIYVVHLNTVNSDIFKHLLLCINML